ncbi:MAG: hypothetical protein EOP78_13195, partial [Variovorax sp.]
MQLGRALAQHAHEREEGAMVGRSIGFGRVAAFRQEALQIRQRVFPRIALVRHEGLQERERHHAAVGTVVLDGARHRHAVGEARHLREVAAHVEFGVDALVDVAIALEEELVAQRDHRVAAGRAWAADFEGIDVFLRHVGQSAGRGEADFAALGRQGQALRDAQHHGAAEGLVVEGIGHQADFGLLAHLGD